MLPPSLLVAIFTFGMRSVNAETLCIGFPARSPGRFWRRAARGAKWSSSCCGLPGAWPGAILGNTFFSDIRFLPKPTFPGRAVALGMASLILDNRRSCWSGGSLTEVRLSTPRGRCAQTNCGTARSPTVAIETSLDRALVTRLTAPEPDNACARIRDDGGHDCDSCEIDLKRLRYLSPYVNMAGFATSHAASVIGVAQPALTRQIQLLERQVGLKLITRNGRGVRADGGRAFSVSRARSSISIGLDNLLLELKRRTSKMSGQAVVGICPTISAFFSRT